MTNLMLDLSKPFLAGILTVFTPCVFPLIPVYFAILTGDKKSRYSRVLATLFFVIGFSIIFTLMGLGATSIGAFLGEQRRILLYVGSAFIILLGLKFAGLFEWKILNRAFSPLKEVKIVSNTYLNSFLLGVIFSLGWTPCAGPILGAVLTYVVSQSADYGLGAAYLASYSVGAGLPFIVLAIVYESVAVHLRVVNRYLLRVQKVTGILLVILGLSILNSLWKIPDVDEGSRVAEAYIEEGTPLNPHLGTQTKNPRFVMFYGDHCRACLRMKPVVQDLENDCKLHPIEMISININDKRNFAVARRFNVRGIPTFSLFDTEGVEKLRLVGEMKQEDLRAAVSVILNAHCAGVEANRKEVLKYLFGERCKKEVFHLDRE